MLVGHLYFSFYPQSVFALITSYPFIIYLYNGLLYQIKTVKFPIIYFFFFSICFRQNCFLVCLQFVVEGERFLCICNQICESNHVWFQPLSGFGDAFGKAYPKYTITKIFLSCLIYFLYLMTTFCILKYLVYL